MKEKLAIVGFLVIVSILGISESYAQSVPEWIKNNAGWWAEDQIEDKDFLKGIEFLLKEKIILIDSVSIDSKSSNEIPAWVKNNAGWWSRGEISDNDFLNGIEFLVSKGIISIHASAITQDDFVGSFDLSQAGPIEGIKNSLFTIIMFSDHQCEKCAKWLQHEKKTVSEKLIQTGIAKFVILDYPMLGEDSETAAEATYCAENQGKYFEYYTILNQKHSGVQNGWASFDSLVNYAREIGLNIEDFDQCLFWNTQSLRVDHNRNVALAHGVVGTPTFFVVGPEGQVEKIVGSQPPMIFERVIQEMS